MSILCTLSVAHDGEVGSENARGRYRWRTRVRRVLRLRLGWLSPKGKADCGDHEWYNHDGVTERCYHCSAGKRPYRGYHFN
jgi:hypothetical protein